MRERLPSDVRLFGVGGGAQRGENIGRNPVVGVDEQARRGLREDLDVDRAHVKAHMLPLDRLAGNAESRRELPHGFIRLRQSDDESVADLPIQFTDLHPSHSRRSCQLPIDRSTGGGVYIVHLSRSSSHATAFISSVPGEPENGSLRSIWTHEGSLLMRRRSLMFVLFACLTPTIAHAQATLAGVVRRLVRRRPAGRHGRSGQPRVDAKDSDGGHRWQRPVPHHRTAAWHLHAHRRRFPGSAPSSAKASR